jgi:hypothetical protein
MKERRKLKRFDLRLPATIELLTPDKEHKLVKLLTSNICAGGAYFHTTQPLPEGTEVQIDLVLLFDKLRRVREKYKQAYVKVTGRVLRSESEGMAICFDKEYEIMGAAQ